MSWNLWTNSLVIPIPGCILTAPSGKKIWKRTVWKCFSAGSRSKNTCLVSLLFAKNESILFVTSECCSAQWLSLIKVVIVHVWFLFFPFPLTHYSIQSFYHSVILAIFIHRLCHSAHIKHLLHGKTYCSQNNPLPHKTKSAWCWPI